MGDVAKLKPGEQHDYVTLSAFLDYAVGTGLIGQRQIGTIRNKVSARDTNGLADAGIVFQNPQTGYLVVHRQRFIDYITTGEL